jgi:hypothetical protein
VRALLHSLYDQPDAAPVHALFARLPDALGDKGPEAAGPREAFLAERHDEWPAAATSPSTSWPAAAPGPSPATPARK